MTSKFKWSAVLLSAAILAGAADSPRQAARAADLNDLQIAHIAYTAGSIDIRYAHLALALSEDPGVREFASLMVRDHGAVNDKALALVEELKITPEDNATSRQLSQQAAQIRDELRQLTGTAFDKRYAANELAYHQAVNGAVEGTLIPAAQNEKLMSLLQSALKTFKVHERHAQDMVAKLQ